MLAMHSGRNSAMKMAQPQRAKQFAFPGTRWLAETITHTPQCPHCIVPQVPHVPATSLALACLCCLTWLLELLSL